MVQRERARPWLPHAAARLATIVVLPTPPFCVPTAIMRAIALLSTRRLEILPAHELANMSADLADQPVSKLVADLFTILFAGKYRRRLVCLNRRQPLPWVPERPARRSPLGEGAQNSHDPRPARAHGDQTLQSTAANPERGTDRTSAESQTPDATCSDGLRLPARTAAWVSAFEIASAAGRAHARVGAPRRRPVRAGLAPGCCRGEPLGQERVQTKRS